MNYNKKILDQNKIVSDCQKRKMGFIVCAGITIVVLGILIAANPDLFRVREMLIILGIFSIISFVSLFLQILKYQKSSHQIKEGRFVIKIRSVSDKRRHRGKKGGSSYRIYFQGGGRQSVSSSEFHDIEIGEKYYSVYAAFRENEALLNYREKEYDLALELTGKLMNEY